jgi:hypothetical protein
MELKPDKILYGKDQFYNNLNNKIYQIYKIDTLEKEIYMINIFNQFIKNKNKKNIIAIDFEFNKVSKTTRDVALMQINLENTTDIGYIFILDPAKLKKVNYKILIKLITRPKIIKVLHGSESLDIPYLFNQLLIKKKYIDNFCKNFYDTKIICDYLNISYLQKKSCSIYDFLFNTNIINQKQLDNLNKIEEKMGPIYLIYIDIYKLDDNLLNYALYDVLYLPELIKKLLNYDMESSSWYILISELLAIINKYKRNIEPSFNILELLINNMNNYYIIHNKKKYNLHTIWESYYIVLTSDKIINVLNTINYFKYFFKIITKFIVYYNISKCFNIYINKQNIFKDSNKFNDVFIWLQNYPHINYFVNECNDFILQDLKQ